MTARKRIELVCVGSIPRDSYSWPLCVSKEELETQHITQFYENCGVDVYGYFEWEM